MKPEINPYDNIIGGLIVVRRVVIAIGIIVSVAIGFGSGGCRLGTPDFAPPWDGNTNAITNSVSRAWKAGLVLTFPNLPSNETKELMVAAGMSLAAILENQEVYVLYLYDRSNAAQNAALEAALREGAMVTGR